MITDADMIDAQTLAQSLAARREAGREFFLIDVRTAQEHAVGRIPGSILIPLAILSEQMKGIKLDREIVLHCARGPRSCEGFEVLRGMGYARVKVLKGGYEAWREKSEIRISKSETD